MLKDDALNAILAKKTLLSKNNLICSDVERKNYNYEFTASENGINIKIQLYFGKKGLKTVIQGKKETALYHRIINILEGKQEGIFNDTDEVEEPNRYIGSDESGKGDFFGPLVVAAFYCNENISKKLVTLKIKDSKKLSDNKISVLYRNLEEDFGKYFAYRIVEPEEYNRLYKQDNNLNILLNKLHSEVIQQLLSKFPKTENIVVDKFSEQKLVLESNNAPNITYIHKGERYLAVAAASIVARHKFNQWFEQEEIFDLQIGKGASAAISKKAAELAQIFGKEKLDKYAKVHFKIYNKL